MEGAVLITGAGSGIGRACTLYLAERGLSVLAAGRTQDALASVAAEARGPVTPLVLDVTDEADVQAAIARAGPVTTLVNNAGVSVMGPIEGVPIKEWRRQFEVNVFGTVTMTRAVLPGMRAAGRGRIVNIGSVTGRLVPPFMGAYGASKHALEGLTDALRREVKSYGIGVSIVRPGFVRTDFGEQEQESLKANAHPAYRERLDRFAAWHLQNGHRAAPSADVVAAAVHHAVTSKHPKNRYAVPNKAARLIALRNALPTAAVDEIIERVTG